MSAKNKRERDVRKTNASPGYLTVKAVIEALSRCPPNAKVWGYEGEVSGIIIDAGGNGRGGVIHNDGRIEIDGER
jgi:hypothetical protein